MKSSSWKVAVALAASLAASAAAAEDWQVAGFVGVEAQAFWLDAMHPGQHNGIVQSSLIQPEFYWRSDDSRQRVSVVGFARVDAVDSERSHVDLRELYWGLEGDNWDLVAGVNRVFWGVTESRHLVDVINQTDLVENIDEESKLGQPMINVNVQADYGQFGLFVLPYFRERTFPGEDGRFRPALVVDTDQARFESGREEHHVDVALRYSHYVGDVDIGLHVFEGTSREPRFELAADGGSLLPVYDQMTQVGIDVQYTADAWLWKLEAISRDTRVDTFTAAVGGFEYTYFGVRESAADLGLLVEYLYDDRNAVSPPTVFDNELFVGARLALNDASDTSMLAGVTTDLDTRAMFLNVEAERRLSDNLSAELQLRAVMNANPGDFLYNLERDDHVQLRLNWYY